MFGFNTWYGLANVIIEVKYGLAILVFGRVTTSVNLQLF